MRKKFKPIIVKIEKPAPGGEGLARYGQRLVLVNGVLPGETAEVIPYKRRRGLLYARLLELKSASRFRVEPREDHYMSCGPWQVAAPEKQLQFKLDTAKELFREHANFWRRRRLDIQASPHKWSYRNKMEFSFTEDAEGGLHAALHQRGRRGSFYPLDGCVLAHERINQAARLIVSALRRRQAGARDLKSLVLRYSYYEDKVIAALYVRDDELAPFELNDEILKGWHIIYSDPRSPASVTSKVLLAQGERELVERIRNYRLKYDYDGFFQVNPPCFELLLNWVAQNIEPRGALLDLYSGVGTIGLCLHDSFEKVFSVESDERAVRAARDNLKMNNIKNVDLIAGKSEKQDLREILDRVDTLIVDPPRAGLHPRVVKRIMESGPRNFTYISCNPKTQAADLAALKKVYKIKKWKLFDLYPQTPHVESVMILKRK